MSTNSPRVAQYEKAADEILCRIRSGQLKPGDKLPTHRVLADELGVAVGTLQRALRELETQGWVTSRPTVGVFVNGIPEGHAKPVTLEQLSQEVADLRTRVAKLEGFNDRPRPGKS